VRPLILRGVLLASCVWGAGMWGSMVLAQELPDGIACVAAAYDADQQAQIAAAAAAFDTMKGRDGSTKRLAEISAEAALACAQRHGWSEDEYTYATLYATARLKEAAFRSAEPLLPEQLAQLDAALADSGSEEAWPALERMVTREAQGGGAKAPAGEDRALGTFILFDRPAHGRCNQSERGLAARADGAAARGAA
jgi:hypothetical protein